MTAESSSSARNPKDIAQKEYKRAKLMELPKNLGQRKIDDREMTPEENNIEKHAYEYAIQEKDRLFEKYDSLVSDEQHVIFMSGGTGPGKTTFARGLAEKGNYAYVSGDEFKIDLAQGIAERHGLESKALLAQYSDAIHKPAGDLSRELFWLRIIEGKSIIYDSNLTGASARKRVEQMMQMNISSEILFVHRDPVEAWFHGVIPRQKKIGRMLRLDTHARTHVEAIQDFLSLYDKFKDNPLIHFRVFDNLGKEEPIERTVYFLREQVYSEDDVKRAITSAGEKAHGQTQPGGDR